MRKLLLLTGGLAWACAGEPPKAGGDPEALQDSSVVEAFEQEMAELEEMARLLRPKEGTPEDWEVVREKAEWAWGQGLDLVDMGESMAQIGLTFVGTPYAPGTLELSEPEEVVVNLQELDCVTFVENVLALSRLIRVTDSSILDSQVRLQEVYRGLLQEIRYRGGRLDGYPSRLHYFSEWIQDNETKGLVREITADLGGEENPEAVDFMSSHPDAYRQLADPYNLEAIRRIEETLSSRTRYRISEENITAAASGIRDGDIIAATSTVEGLDVAHTGLAVWQGGALHLLHAPLVGEAVQVSRQPLAERILRIDGQDGIQVARPLEPEAAGGIS